MSNEGDKTTVKYNTWDHKIAARACGKYEANSEFELAIRAD